MSFLLAPLQFFVFHPERCVAVAVVFVVVAISWAFMYGRVVWSPIVAAIGWLLFAWMEHYCHEEGMNIRVDLLFTGPMLFALTLLGILWPLRGLKEDRYEGRDEGGGADFLSVGWGGGTRSASLCDTSRLTTDELL